MVNDRKINILFLVPSLRRAGAETQVVDLVGGLDGRIFNKSVVTFEPGMDQQDRLEKSDVIFSHFRRKRKVDISVARNIATVIDEQKIDIVHCTLQIALLMGWLALRFANRKPKLIVAVHTTLHRSFKDKLLDRLVYRRLLYSCDRVIFVCKSQADHWMRIHRNMREKSIVVYNGVDHKYFDPHQFSSKGREFREVTGIGPDMVVVTCIAGFRPEKGHEFLIEAFAGITNKACLILAGDGERRKSITQLVRNSGVSNRIFMLGNVTDVRPVIAASDVVVLASTAVETFSIAMLESMAMEVPVVATDIGGLGEAVKSGLTGELVEPGNADSLRDVLEDILSSADKRRSMGKKARKSVIEHFSKETMVQQTQKILLDVVGCSNNDCLVD